MKTEYIPTSWARLHESSSGEVLADDFSSSESKRQNYQVNKVVARINKQNINISGGVHDGKEDLEEGTGNQIIMFEYANGGTEDAVTDMRRTGPSSSSPW